MTFGEVTLNENCGYLQDYPATIVAFERPHFLTVRPFGCVNTIRITPGHVVEEDAVVEAFGF